MDKPVIAKKTPIRVKLEKGKTYYYCTCGKSDDQPFCNGAHKGTSFTPMAFTAEKDGAVSLCPCKQTKNPPYCDGSHMKLTFLGRLFKRD